MSAQVLRPPTDNFFEIYKEPISDLCGTFEHDFEQYGFAPPTTPRHIVEATQYWAHGDHLVPLHPFDLNPAQTAAAHTLFDLLHMRGEVSPPKGHAYNTAIILGGLVLSNENRTEFMARQLADPNKSMALKDEAQIVFWGGPRESFEGELTDVTRLLGEVTLNPDIYDALGLSSNPAHIKPESVDETVQGILAFQKYFGRLTLKEVVARSQSKNSSGPQNSSYIFTAQNTGDREIVVFNGPTVDRGDLQGKPRHTTLSTALAWYGQPRYRNRGDDPILELFVANNPYIGRTTKIVGGILRTMTPPPIDVYGCGPEGPSHIDDRLRLGELARRLYTEYRRTL